MNKPNSHWNKHARQWQHIRPPLRPCREDIDILERAIAIWHRSRQSGSIRALLLGVTPEIATLCWLKRTDLLALDLSHAMLHNVWPGSRLAAVAACADWARMPLADGSRDVVVGDGCYTLLGYPQGYREVTTEVRRVLSADGLFIMRFFVRPDQPEPLENVWFDLRAGCIGNFHILKWRLAMALHGSLEEGVRLADVWEAWSTSVPDHTALGESLHWPVEEIATIDAYRGVAARYTFPTLAEARATLSAAFSEIGCHVPSYELGQRCPTLVMSAR
ncbi:MAG: methyltransferase domain-containing protein [Burkholderiales bacterium]